MEFLVALNNNRVSIETIKQAAHRLAGHAVLTPCLRFDALDAAVGAQVYIKPENLQRSGSFKFRGAFNRLSQLGADERVAGVVAYSSGNHAQGVALAAQILDVPATIVMPRDAPEIKKNNTEAYGAKIVLYDRYTEDRKQIGQQISDESGATLVPPFDDPAIISGQGTVGLELCQQVQAGGDTLDILLAPAGGGGLIAGVSTATKALSPKTDIYAVEPIGFDDTGRSLRAGQRIANAEISGSMCDALLAPMPGALTFSINRYTVTGGLAVADSDVAAAMRFAAEEFKLVLEPGGAITLAALLSKAIDVTGKTAAIILSGGNVDPATQAQLTSQ